MRGFALFLGAVLALALPAAAQQGGTIAPGMSADEVRAAFGSPALTREQGTWSYLFYTNRCLPRCGSDDVVFLRDGRVVAAVLRSPERRFTGGPAASVLQTLQPEPGGEGARPEGMAGENAQPGTVRMDTAGGAAVRGIRIQAPGAAPASREPPVNLGVIRGRAPAPSAPPRDSLAVGADTLAPDTTAGRPGTPADTAARRRNAPVTNRAALPPPPPLARDSSGTQLTPAPPVRDTAGVRLPPTEPQRPGRVR